MILYCNGQPYAIQDTSFWGDPFMTTDHLPIYIHNVADAVWEGEE